MTDDTSQHHSSSPPSNSSSPAKPRETQSSSKADYSSPSPRAEEKLIVGSQPEPVSGEASAPIEPIEQRRQTAWQLFTEFLQQRPPSSLGQDQLRAAKRWATSNRRRLSQPLDSLNNLQKRLPLKAAQEAAQTVAQKASETATDWIADGFNVSEAQIADILASVRAELPTTEALLIGKPQAGKSSIVRGITGVSADIIGQGYRPHTQHMERYAYPSTDLPLLVFTDTVGLGDANQATEEILAEVTAELNQEKPGARILILTVKINDFATDSLRAIAQALRQSYPQVPILLAVTCLHELYPTTQQNHPSYPPTSLETVERAFQAIQQDFQGLYDQAVLLDFTLAEDGFEPMFYGLESLRDRLAELLPEAESRAIEQLLNEQEEVNTQLGNLYRDVGRRYMSAFAVIAATLAALPLPFATMPVVTALQVSMVGLLGKLYGQTISSAQAGGIVSTIAGGFLAQAIGRELVKFIPGLGSVVAASWAAAYTWALGESACVYFGDLMGGKTPDPEEIQGVMRAAFSEAKERFKQTGPVAEPSQTTDHKT